MNHPAGVRWDETVDVPLTRLELAALWNLLVAVPPENRKTLCERKGSAFEGATRRVMDKLNSAIDSSSELERTPMPGLLG